MIWLTIIVLSVMVGLVVALFWRGSNLPYGGDSESGWNGGGHYSDSDVGDDGGAD